MDEIDLYCASYRLFLLKYTSLTDYEGLLYVNDNDSEYTISDDDYSEDENIYKKKYNNNSLKRVTFKLDSQPSKKRKNHQAITKPFRNANGMFPCPNCNREFTHAPAMMAHNKKCVKKTF